jgi:hypothetical protein
VKSFGGDSSFFFQKKFQNSTIKGQSWENFHYSPFILLQSY